MSDQKQLLSFIKSSSRHIPKLLLLLAKTGVHSSISRPSRPPVLPKPNKLAALGARRKLIIRLIIKRAIRVRVAAIQTSPRTRHILLRSILRTTTARRNTEITRQIAWLKHDPRTAALRLALLAYAERAARVARVADVEGHLGGVAVPGAFAEPVVLEPAAGGAGFVDEVLVQGFAAAGVVFGLVRDLAFHADGLQAVDCGGGAGLRVALIEERAGAGVASVGTCGYGGGVVAARVEGVVGLVWVEGGRGCGLPGQELIGERGGEGEGDERGE